MRTVQEPLLFRTESEAPEVSEKDIAQFIDYLERRHAAGHQWPILADLGYSARKVKIITEANRRGWTLRQQFEVDLGWDERMVRAIASAARPRVVSYPGSPGYKLWAHCTVEEHDRCLASFRSARDEADASYMVYLRAYHSRGRK